MAIKQTLVCDACGKQHELGGNKCGAPGCHANHGGFPADWISFSVNTGAAVTGQVNCCSKACAIEYFDKLVSAMSSAPTLHGLSDGLPATLTDEQRQTVDKYQRLQKDADDGHIPLSVVSAFLSGHPWLENAVLGRMQEALAAGQQTLDKLQGKKPN
jgi:hypothetical protein